MTDPHIASMNSRGAVRRLVPAVLMLIGGGAVWGATFPLAKLITEAGIHPFGLALLSGLIGALILLPYSLARRGGIPLRRDFLKVYLVAGALGTAIPSSVVFFAASRMPAGISAIIISLVPLMTYGVSLIMRVERFQGRRAIGTGIGLAAILMIVLPDAGLPKPSMTPWVLFVLIAPLAYACENVYIAARRPPKSTPYALLCGMLAAGALILLPLVWVTDTWVPLESLRTPLLWWIIALTAVNLVGYLLFLELILLAGPLFAAQIGYVVTASGVLWGIAVFGETHSAWIWAAIAVLFTGVALVHPRESESSDG